MCQKSSFYYKQVYDELYKCEYNLEQAERSLEMCLDYTGLYFDECGKRVLGVGQIIECNGHGTCLIYEGVCSCDKGYWGDYCEKTY